MNPEIRRCVESYLNRVQNESGEVHNGFIRLQLKNAHSRQQLPESENHTGQALYVDSVAMCCADAISIANGQIENRHLMGVQERLDKAQKLLHRHIPYNTDAYTLIWEAISIAYDNLEIARGWNDECDLSDRKGSNFQRKLKRVRNANSFRAYFKTSQITS